MSGSAITERAAQATLSTQIVGRLHQLMESGLESVKEVDPYYRNLVDWIGRVARGEVIPEGPVGQVTRIERDNKSQSHWFVFPLTILNEDPSKDLLRLGKREMPSNILRQIEEEFGLNDFEIVSSECECVVPLVQSMGKTGASLNIGKVVGIL